MYISNMIELLQVSGAYLLLFSLIPFWVRGFKLSGKDVLDNLVTSYIIGNMVIINAVFLLSLIGIYNRITMILLLIAIAAGYRYFFKRKETVNVLKRAEEYFINLKEGYYHPRRFARDIKEKITFFIKSFYSKIHYPLNLLILIAALWFAADYRCRHTLTTMPFGTSDMYLHVQWIKYIDLNRPFVGGIYPFGLHCVVSAIGMVFGIDVVTIMRMLGSVMGMMIVFALYYILRRTFKSFLAANVGMVFYCVLDVFSQGAILRQMLALPQEYGMIFMYFGGAFLHKYMKEKDMTALVCCVSSVALTFMSHFYVTIYAVVLCGAVFIGDFIYINKKVFMRILIAAVCALFVALAPMIAAYAKGIPLQSSLFWALSVMKGEDYFADRKVAPSADPYAVVTATPSKTPSEEESGGPAPKKSLSERLSGAAASFLPNMTKVGVDSPWQLIFLGSLGCGFLVFLVKQKGKPRQFEVLGVTIYAFLALVLRLMPMYGLPAVMDASRLSIFLVYAIPLALAAPVELLYNIFHSMGKVMVWLYALIAAAIAGSFGYYIYDGSHYCAPGGYYRMQYDGAVTAYYMITRDHPDFSWTILSTTDEYVLCLNKGYHYEQSDFIAHLHEFEESGELIIPTRYVFVYIDKRPSHYAPWINPLNPPAPYPLITADDVTAPFDELVWINKKNVLYIYKHLEANIIMQAKTYEWAHEYMKYFPNEMELFYEDDEFAVFKIEQNPFALNNFSIRYAGNAPDAYYDFTPPGE